MSVTIDFYQATGDPRRVSKDLTLLASKSCELKGDCSIKNPSLIITGDAADFALCNYVYIADFQRYYYADAPTVLPGGMLQVNLTCDVLASAWPWLSELEAVVSLNSHEFNLYLNDGTFRTYADDTIDTIAFPQGFTSKSYIMVLAGG